MNKKSLLLLGAVYFLSTGMFAARRDRGIAKSLKYAKRCETTCNKVSKQACDCDKVCEPCARECNYYKEKITGDKIYTLAEYRNKGCKNFAKKCMTSCKNARIGMKKCSEGKNKAHKKCRRACKKLIKRLNKINKRCAEKKCN